MCESITMPNGDEIETIREDDKCLCNSTTREIMTWIIEHVPLLVIGDRLEMERTPFGWEVQVMR